MVVTSRDDRPVHPPALGASFNASNRRIKVLGHSAAPRRSTTTAHGHPRWRSCELAGVETQARYSACPHIVPSLDRSSDLVQELSVELDDERRGHQVAETRYRSPVN